MSVESLGNRRIAKNTILLYFRMLFLMVISLFTSRINLQSLGVEDFGIYNVVGGVVSSFAVISGALGVAISRNITFELGKGDMEKLNKVFSMSINIQFCIGLLVVILAETVGLWFFKTKMVVPVIRYDAAFWVYQCSLISFIVGLLSVPYNASIIAHEKMSAFAYITVLEAVLKLLLAYFVFVTPFDKLITFASFILFIQLLLRFIYGVYCKRHFEECTYRFTTDRALFKQMTGFAGWTMFGNLAWVGYTYGLNILLNLFFGPTVNAARGIAVQVQNAIQGFCTNFQMALNPQITKNYASGDLRRMHQLIFASSKYSFFLLLLLSLPVLIETQTILKVWLGVVPDYTVNFLRLILLIIMVEAMSNPFTVGAQANGNIKNYQIVVGGIMLFIIPVSYFFLSMGFPPESVFVVHLSIVIICQIARLLFGRHLIGVRVNDYINFVLIRVVIVSVTSMIIPLLVHHSVDEGIGRFFVVSFLCLVCVVLSIYIFGLLDSERNMVKGKASDIINKLSSYLINKSS